jgi:hypothetical protein
MSLKVDILGKQKRSKELGIIRVGNAKDKGWNRPRAGFRITSRFRDQLEEVQKVYGGTFTPWEGKPGFWDLDTDVSSLRVMISHDHSLSQWLEQWGQSGCTHRCDGDMCERHDKDGNAFMVGCLCDPNDRKCDFVTRINVAFSNVPVLGLWRLNSKSKIFGAEVQAAFDMMEDTGLSAMNIIYCTLGMQLETKRIPGKKPEHFTVPNLLLDPNPPNFAAVIQGVQQRQLTGQPASVPMIEAPKPQVEEPAVALPFEPCEQVDPAVFDQSNTSWIHCDTCSFIVASLRHGNGKRRHYNHDGRQHKPLCGQPTGWNEIPPIEGDFREAA